jgi:hypothetical protein
LSLTVADLLPIDNVSTFLLQNEHNNRYHSLHTDIRSVALANRRSTVRRRRERSGADAVGSRASVAAARPIVEGEAHRNVIARNTREVTLAEVGGREVALEQGTASAVRLTTLAGLAKRTAGKPLQGLC